MDHGSKNFTLAVLPDLLAVCRLEADAQIPAWAVKSRFFSLVRTTDELSILCAATDVPHGITQQPGWRCLKVAGPLDFALTGVLARLLQPLADAAVSIFAVSTYDTDYILVKQETLAAAVAALRRAGHDVETC